MVKKLLGITLAVMISLSPSIASANSNNSLSTKVNVASSEGNNNYKEFLSNSKKVYQIDSNDLKKSEKSVEDDLNKIEPIENDVDNALLNSLQKSTKSKSNLGLIRGVQAIDNTTHKPIANLKYVIMNPDSLKNGQITTNTQIAWLWSYNGENYTYDPDGYKITNMNITGTDGVKDSIIGTLTGNIGFATQFKTAGQYIMKFKCMNEKNVWSDEWSISIPVEPTDNNTRPQCIINYSTLSGDTNTQFAFGWFNSKDNDANDSIKDVQGVAMKDGVETSLSNYITNQDKDGCTMKFKEAGTYTLMFRVSDTHGAWSNWTALDVVVTKIPETQITNVKIISDSDDDYKYFYTNTSTNGYIYGITSGIWLDEKVAYDNYTSKKRMYYKSTFKPYSEYSSSDQTFSTYGMAPEEIVKRFAIEPEHRKVVENGFTVKGTINKPNTPLAVAFDLFGTLYKEKVTSDANGNFSVYFDLKKITSSMSEFTKKNTKYVFYGNLSTSFMEPSTVSVITSDKMLNTPVYVHTDFYTGRMLIKSFIYSEQLNQWVGGE
ncbi:hypothetical protein NNC19_06155 [Clostridium sp. SHJSY1]|uniref:hypothetical protein n=1 Tax=Clostridium sp. SHJSY1 TaxID=2942483 RepID=UPI002874E820|nr:hypothetical protein [Clostridium sp. SHJSY1]MDS0525257.1 hypothetical protein [Clostridium sp. SHJSY1]